MLPKPQSRLELLLNKIATNTMNDLPIPQSRLELLVSALITNDIDNLPSPQSRSEAILHCILLDTECNITPQSRVELFLKSIITLDIEGLPTPMSRLEWYLDYIVRNGCLEKYEYYPFNIWSYLNVKNTPKARMKFKGMKGNTLVNICPQKRISFTRQGGDSTKYFLREFVVPMAKRNTIYTIIVNVLSTPATNYTTLFSWINDGAMGTPKDYKLSTTGMHVFTMRTNDIDFPKGITFRFASGHGGVDGEYICDDLVILEGDHTQNPPNGYIEGIKSFGESENKIEVLIDNNLQGELNQSSKATLMYRNSSNELVPIPILRGKWENGKFLWGDEILEHDDGKLYYHKRCENFILNGGSSEVYTVGNNLTNTLMFRIKVKSCTANLICDKFGVVGNAWSTDNELAFLYVPDSLLDIRININKLETQDVSGFKKWLQTNNVTVVYQLAEEVVYPCELSEQLYSYDGETNIFINGGAVVGETTIEIGTKLGPIVAEIKQETLRNTKAVEGLLSHGVQEMAYQLYPEDFNKSIETVPTESVE